MQKVDGGLIEEMWALHTGTADKLDMDLSELTAEDTFIFGAMHACAFFRESAIRQHPVGFKQLNEACEVLVEHLKEKGVLK